LTDPEPEGDQRGPATPAAPPAQAESPSDETPSDPPADTRQPAPGTPAADRDSAPNTTGTPAQPVAAIAAAPGSAPAAAPVASPGIIEPTADAPAAGGTEVEAAVATDGPSQEQSPPGAREPASEPDGEPIAAPPGTAITTNAPVVPPAPALPPDAAATRSAMGLLTNLMSQSQIAPGADFIGRLAAAAAGYWSDAPEVQSAVAGSARAFRITSPTGGGPIFVADNGAGNDVTIIIPRADADIVHSMLESAAELSLAAPDEGAGEPGTPADPAVEQYGVTLSGEPAGLLTISPVRQGPGAGGLAIFFHATTPIPAAGSAAGAAADVTYEVQPGGSIKLSNGTVIQGAGTPENPYAVTWDLLVSAERVYQPRNGLTTMPKWCDALHLKHVRITGHLLSPLMMDDTTQILLMRNQWDGCCVGVPPTPYDAIEVELSRPVSLVREQLNYGTITGVLEVDPYLVNNWLVGLWIVSEAKIDNSGAQNWAVPAGGPN
jgi:hypothetical protein